MSTPVRRLEALSLDQDMRQRRGQSGRVLSDVPTSATARPGASEEASSSDSEEDTPYSRHLPSISSPRGISHPSLSTLTEAATKLVPSSPRDRATDVRDMLSTYDAMRFPSETIEIDRFDRAAAMSEPIALTDCVEKEDLLSTLFQAGVSNPLQYLLLRQMLPEERCALLFHEKVKRRFDKTISDYDSLGQPSSTVIPGSQAGTRSRVVKMANDRANDLANDLRQSTTFVAEDLKLHQRAEADLARHLLNLLQDVCQRDINKTQTRPGSSSGQQSAAGNLCQTLIRSASSEPFFMIDALKALSDNTIDSQQAQTRHTRSLLVNHRASAGYLQAFDRATNRGEEGSGPSQLTQPLERTGDRPEEESGSSQPAQGQKRPAGGNGRGGQKRTK